MLIIKKKIGNEKYFELKLSSVFRDNEEDNIPNQTSLNKKNSDLFGSMDYKFSEILSIDYNFAVDKLRDLIIIPSVLTCL